MVVVVSLLSSSFTVLFSNVFISNCTYTFTQFSPDSFMSCVVSLETLYLCIVQQ